MTAGGKAWARRTMREHGHSRRGTGHDIPRLAARSLEARASLSEQHRRRGPGVSRRRCRVHVFPRLLCGRAISQIGTGVMAL